MILTGSQITRARDDGLITLEPFAPERVQPNSYDLALGPTLLRYTEHVLDVARENHAEEIHLTDEGFLLEPDRVYLGHSVEELGSDHYVPQVRARSGTARLGLFTHITADLIDLGSRGQTTFQLHAVQPVRIYPGMVLGQVTFWAIHGPKELYRGKYQGSQGPQPSRAWQDFATAGRSA